MILREEVNLEPEGEENYTKGFKEYMSVCVGEKEAKEMVSHGG